MRIVIVSFMYERKVTNLNQLIMPPILRPLDMTMNKAKNKRRRRQTGETL